jgi:membrane-associated phospholipid phosphatase
MTPENKNLTGAVMFAIASLLYIISNRYQFSAPRLLPMSSIDLAIPFVPETVWIYLSEYVFFIAVYVNCKDMANANKYIYSFFALQFVSVLIFVLWPTTFPRDLYPLPADLDALTYFAFHTLRQSDTPANCLPSLHVSSVYLSAYIFLDDQRKKFPLFLVWGTLIALSTLPTKQHYLVDIVAGFAMSIVFYWIFHRWIPYRSVVGLGPQRALHANR